MTQTNHLPEGTLLRGGIYKIIRFISSGGFGCTYEALDTSMGISVCIKEFFVSEYCNREDDGMTVTVGTHSRVELVEKLRNKFKDEAMRIYSLKHGGVVRVSAVFDENGTSYYAMDFIKGKSLQDISEERGPLPEAEAVSYIQQVCDALSYVHGENILHLDIKPANIMIDEKGNAIIIDFGVSKQYDEVNGQNTSTLLGFSAGYAPPEQMSNKVRQFEPASDIYALGATLYTLLSGKIPPLSSDRSSGDEIEPLPSTVSNNTRAAVDKAMSLNRKQRPQSVSEFSSMLNDNFYPQKLTNNASSIISNSSTTLKYKKTSYFHPRRHWKWLAYIGWMLAAIGVISLAIFFFQHFDSFLNLLKRIYARL